MEKKYELPKEFAEKWIVALRSGEYGQVTGVLKMPYHNKYCCLGVASKIEGCKNFNASGWIPYFGVPKSIPLLLRGHDSENDFVGHVSKMNDTGSSFPEIADWIEANTEFI